MFAELCHIMINKTNMNDNNRKFGVYANATGTQQQKHIYIRYKQYLRYIQYVRFVNYSTFENLGKMLCKCKFIC